ncbi:hypothetical protein [Vibrio crassostreae]|uniref:hypothetical protein n=1 Tax=Vibrio crassostreae TaxID=246167 RepID=UPI001B31146A|nr:hypothetical protein [Vibrio crassostreae]
MNNIFKHMDNVVVKNETISATVSVCRNGIESIVRGCMTLGHKMTVSDFAINKFSDRIAQLLETTLRKEGTILNHCDFIRLEVLKASRSLELDVACGWTKLKENLILQLNTIS